MRMNKKTRNLLLGILGVGLIVGVASLITNMFKTDEDGFKEITPTFEVGGIDEDGKYLDTKASIYTKDLIKAEQVKVELDFDADITYDLYFYYENEFVETYSANDKSLSINLVDELMADGFRIVIHPTWSEDVAEEDREIKLWEIGTLKNQIKVCVYNTPIVEEALPTEIVVNASELTNSDLKPSGSGGNKDTWKFGSGNDFLMIDLSDYADYSTIVVVYDTEDDGTNVPTHNYLFVANEDIVSGEAVSFVDENYNLSKNNALSFELEIPTNATYLFLKNSTSKVVSLTFKA